MSSAWPASSSGEQAVPRPDHLGRVGLGEVDLLGIEVVAGICRNWNERGAGRSRGNWVAVAVDGDVDRLEEVRLGGEPGDTDDGAVDVSVERHRCVPVGTDRLGVTGRALVGRPIVAHVIVAPEEVGKLALLPA